MDIDIDVLENVIMKIFADLKSRGVSSVPFDADFYWSIPSDALYDSYNKPVDLGIGQLEEDYENLLRASEKDLLIGYHLKCVSALIRYLSEKCPA